MVLAAMLYIHRVTETTSVEPVTAEYIKDGKAHVLQDKQIPPYVTILRIHGPFLFGAAKKLEEATADLSHYGPVIVLCSQYDGLGCDGRPHARSVRSPRASRGPLARALRCRKQPAKLIRHSDLPEILGKDSIVPHVDAALNRAQSRLPGIQRRRRAPGPGVGRRPDLIRLAGRIGERSLTVIDAADRADVDGNLLHRITRLTGLTLFATQSSPTHVPAPVVRAPSRLR